MLNKIAPNTAGEAANNSVSLLFQPQAVLHPVANYDDVRDYLVGVAKKYKKLRLSVSEIPTITALKTEMVGYRRQIEKIAAQIKEERFNAPKKMFDGKINELLTLISPIEGLADKYLNDLEVARCKEVTEILDFHRDTLLSKYKLSDSYKEEVIYAKSFYNKGQKEVDSVNAITSQIECIAKRESDKRSDIEFIMSSALADSRINPDTFIALYERGESLSSVLGKIKEEVSRLHLLDNPPETTEDTAQVLTEEKGVYLQEKWKEGMPKTIVGECKKLPFDTSFPANRKCIVLELDYPSELSGTLADVFDLLKKEGIKIKAVTKDVAF